MPDLQTVQAAFERLVAENPLPPPPAPAPAATAPAEPQSAVPAAAPVAPVQVRNATFSARGVHLDVDLRPGQLVRAAELMNAFGFAIDAVTGVDWMAHNEMEVIHDYFHPEGALRVAVRARVPRDAPEAPTISGIFPGANWHERETHEFFGIVFAGHPNLIPLLLPEDATFHPLRKDYGA